MSDSQLKYHDLGKLTIWVKYFIYSQIVISLIALWSGTLEINLLKDFNSGAYSSQELAMSAAEANDSRQQLVGVAQLFIFVISGIFILRWIFLSNKNARALGAKGMKFTPGWSVGWYFIPIFSLWKPYQAMREIWTASYNPNNWQLTKRSNILPWWWFFWLIASFLGNISFRMAMDADEIDELINSALITYASDISSIPLAYVTLVLISSIYRAQTFVANHAANQPLNNGRT